MITPQFSDQTEQVILQRIMAAIDDELDKRQGSVVYDLTAPAAQELEQAYIALDLALSYAFINEDMPSDILTQAASDMGVDRKPSSQASGLVRFTGPVGQFVPLGTQVRTDSGIYFTTQTDATLVAGTATVEVLAVVGGAQGNVAANDLSVMTGDLTGIVSVTNPDAFDNGVDEESDEALLQRVYDKLRKPATSGNAYHYEQWAKEVVGVGGVHVYPVWDGPGTVKVVLLSDTKRAPNSDTIDDVIAHIDEVKPIGADVTVIGAEEIELDIEVDLTLLATAEVATVQADIETAITTYLETLAFMDSVIRYTQIAAIILDVPGVVDYANLTINNVTGNVVVTGDQVAVLGTVTINAI